MRTDEILTEARQYHQNGQYELARSRYQEILSTDPENAMALYGLAITANHGGDYALAENSLKRVIAQVPGDAHLHNTLGLIKRARGDIDAAIASHEQALELAPGDHAALSALGAIYRDMGYFDTAIEYYTRATAAKPEDVVAWSNLGNALWQEERHEEATQAFRKAVAAAPDQAYTHGNLGNALQEQGDYEAALECYAKAAELARTADTIIGYQTTIPVIPESSLQIAETRKRLQENLALLIDSNLTIADPVREIGKTNFTLAYQGRDDRDLLKAFAELYIKACPDLSYVAPHCNGAGPSPADEKIKVGFISRYFKNHSIGRTSSGIIANLPRERLHIVADLWNLPWMNSVTLSHAARMRCSCYRTILWIPVQHWPKSDWTSFSTRTSEWMYSLISLRSPDWRQFDARRSAIRSRAVYPVLTILFPPRSGGLAQAEQHYSEKLIKLGNVTAVAYYEKPAMPDTLLLHENFGLDAQDNLYICPQALFKFHPDFDEVLAGILRADENGRLILIEGKFKHWTTPPVASIPVRHARCHETV